MNLKFATCLANISSTTGAYWYQQTERERQRETEIDRESHFLFMHYYLLMILDSPFSVKLGMSVVS